MNLPNRRENYTVFVEHGHMVWDVTYGIYSNQVVECFCSASELIRVGTDIQATLTDACIAISRLLQRGDTIIDISNSFGENRLEGEQSGPPSSLMGAIARTGVELERGFKAKTQVKEYA